MLGFKALVAVYLPTTGRFEVFQAFIRHELLPPWALACEDFEGSGKPLVELNLLCVCQVAFNEEATHKLSVSRLLAGANKARHLFNIKILLL